MVAAHKVEEAVSALREPPQGLTTRVDPGRTALNPDEGVLTLDTEEVFLRMLVLIQMIIMVTTDVAAVVPEAMV